MSLDLWSFADTDLRVLGLVSVVERFCDTTGPVSRKALSKLYGRALVKRAVDGGHLVDVGGLVITAGDDAELDGQSVDAAPVAAVVAAAEKPAALSAAAERMRRYRNAKRNAVTGENVTGVTESVTRDVTGRNALRVAPAPALSLSGSLSSVFAEKEENREQEERENAREGVTLLRVTSNEVTQSYAQELRVTPSVTPTESERNAALVTPEVTPAKKAPRATRVPSSEASAAELADWCARWSIETEHAEFDKFVDYFRGKGTTHADWSATWRNWKRRALEYAPRAAAAGGGYASLRSRQVQQGNFENPFWERAKEIT